VEEENFLEASMPIRRAERAPRQEVEPVLFPLHVADDADRPSGGSEGGLNCNPGVLLHARRLIDDRAVECAGSPRSPALRCVERDQP
jgi:hypothetical protein